MGDVYRGNKDRRKTVVLAGRPEEFKQWIKDNFILMTNRHDTARLRANQIEREVIQIGTSYRWVDREITDLLNYMRGGDIEFKSSPY